MRLGAILVVLAPISMLSCALFTSLDGYATDPGSSADAHVGAGDGRADASDLAPSGSDAAGDAAEDVTEGDASPAPFCASYPGAVACTTFDGPSVGAGFDVAKTPDATVAFYTADAVSPPRSMLVTVAPSTSAENEAHGVLRTSLGTPRSRWHARFAFRLVASANEAVENGLEIFALDMKTNGLEHQVNVVIEPTKQIFVDEWSASPSVYVRHELGEASGGWHTLDVTVEVTEVGAGTVTTVLDGASATSPIQPNQAPAARSDVSFGAVLARGVHDGWEVAFDDCVVETP